VPGTSLITVSDYSQFENISKSVFKPLAPIGSASNVVKLESSSLAYTLNKYISNTPKQLIQGYRSAVGNNPPFNVGL